MARSITGHVHFNPDRSMRLLIPGPDGEVDVGATRRTSELGRMAREAVADIYGSEPVDIALLVDQPPWLREGMIVRAVKPDDDQDGTHGHPYGQIVGFLPVGGVMVWRPRTSAEICAPEDLVSCDFESIPPAIVRELTERTGIDPTN